MTEIQHQNVVGMVCGTKTQTNYYLVMEFVNGGDLDGFIKARKGYMPEVEARIVLKGLVQGLMAIKNQNVMHRDLKLANILLNFPRLTKDQLFDPSFNKKEYMRNV